MLAVLLTCVVALGWGGLAHRLLSRQLAPFDPAARVGLSVMLGLGFLGWITLPLGLAGGLGFGGPLMVVGALAGLFLWKDQLPGLRFAMPKGAELVCLGVLAFAGLFALFGVLAPSTSMDWDSIAYHLAVPKMWLQAGRIEPVSFIHHSNFPFLVDNLYVWGLWWGGQAGAKAFSLVYLAAGCLTLFGLGRQKYGGIAGWLAAASFATIPVVLWESGTAYLDVAHGLYAGLGAALLFWSPRSALLGGLLLGCAVGSKYTGLQSAFAAAAVLLGAGMIAKERSVVKVAAVGALACLLVGIPWYVKNAAWTGNPVFPFFYERFGGKNWDQFSADIYREEQKTFGVPSAGVGEMALSLPHSVLGLAYQPGRYTNPNPKLVVDGQQTSGANGFPFGAVGFAVFAAGLFWLASGRLRAFEGQCLAWVGISLLAWVVLSQQSRYIVSLAPPLCLLLGGAFARLPAGRLLGAAAAIQAALSFYLLFQLIVKDQMRVAFGTEDAPAYAEARVPLLRNAEEVNRECKGGRVGLYDEVFGFYLDVPYYWANPGHSTELDYAGATTGADLAERMRGLGITHIYLSLSFQDQAFRDRWLSAMGLTEPKQPFTTDERNGLDSDLRTKWKRLLADAVNEGQLELVKPLRGAILLKVRER